MFDFLLDAASSIRQVPYETVADKLAVGSEVTLRGIGTVFAVLILIWFLVELLHLLLGEKTKPVKEESAKPAEPAVVKVAEPVAEEPAYTSTENDIDEGTLVAIITAAIAAEEGASPNSFRVVSFKRANKKFINGK